MKKNQKMFCCGAILLVLFVLWTVLVSFVDVQAIGPQGSEVGLSALNQFVQENIGVSMPIYVVTDWLSLIPIGFVVGFAVFGVVQLIKRKSILKVDREILLLGAFYLTVAAVYVIFEVIIINYRPILIDGQLEASYPSSTTVLVLCVMLTAAIQLNCRIKNKVMRSVVLCGIVSFVAFMIICRIASGVHWITDIIGGMLISAGLLTIYYSVKKEYKI